MAIESPVRSVAEADRGEFVAGWPQFVAFAGPIVIRIRPKTQRLEQRNAAVHSGERFGLRRQLGQRPHAVAHVWHGSIANQFPSATDAPVAIAVEREEGDVCPYLGPGHLIEIAVGVDVEPVQPRSADVSVYELRGFVETMSAQLLDGSG